MVLSLTKALNLIFDSFRDGLAGVLEIIILLHNPSVLEVTNCSPDIFLQDFLEEHRIHGSIIYGKSSGPVSQRNICPTVMGIFKLFFGKCEISLCILWLCWFSSVPHPFTAFMPNLFLIVEYERIPPTCPSQVLWLRKSREVLKWRLPYVSGWIVQIKFLSFSGCLNVMMCSSCFCCVVYLKVINVVCQTFKYAV